MDKSHVPQYTSVIKRLYGSNAAETSLFVNVAEPFLFFVVLEKTGGGEDEDNINDWDTS